MEILFIQLSDDASQFQKLYPYDWFCASGSHLSHIWHILCLQCCALQPIAHNYVEFMNAVANQRHSDESSLEQQSFEPFLNMCYCLCLCSCETSSVITQVLFLFKVHMSPSTLQIPGCVLAPPFLSMMHQEVTCVNLRQPGIPERISHQSASINDGFFKGNIFKILLLFCHEMPHFRQECSCLKLKSAVYL